MEVIVEISSKKYTADLSDPIDISIPLRNEKSPRAFHAPAYMSKPYADDNFIGALEKVLK